MTAAGTRFGIDLLKQVYQGENAFLSPASASLVLSLTAGGARGETQAEMLRAIRLENIPMNDLHQGNQALAAMLTNPDPQVELTLANAVWHRQELKVAGDFGAMARQHYSAAVEGADRPFLLTIRDDQTGLLFFIGTVVDP